VQVLFLQGGASAQFSAVPLNLSAPGDTVDHITTGSWSKKAAQEAARYANANVVAKGDNKSIPPRSSWNLSPDAKYFHYCDNETIQGVEFKAAPEASCPSRSCMQDASLESCSPQAEQDRCFWRKCQELKKRLGLCAVAI
jgi:phosphoserine aminotransferase